MHIKKVGSNTYFYALTDKINEIIGLCTYFFQHLEFKQNLLCEM